jgi:hypothetical protein
VDFADDIPYLLSGLAISKYMFIYILVNTKNDAWWHAVMKERMNECMNE